MIGWYATASACPHTPLRPAGGAGATRSRHNAGMAYPVLLAAAGLGLAYASAPGAVNAETIRRGVAHGFWPALLVQVGSLLGDVSWAVLALAGLALVLRDATLRATFGLGGGLVLLWFALGALRTAWRPEPVGSLPPRASAGSLATGIVLSIANPFGPIFWLGVGGGLAAGGIADETITGAIAFVGCFAAGALTWGTCVSALLAFGRRWATPVVFRTVDLAVGLAFGWFGITLILDGVRVLRG